MPALDVSMAADDFCWLEQHQYRHPELQTLKKFISKYKLPVIQTRKPRYSDEPTRRCDVGM
jgi:hypothetical protein